MEGDEELLPGFTISSNILFVDRFTDRVSVVTYSRTTCLKVKEDRMLNILLKMFKMND